jgi:hypothetical protein
MADVLTMFSDTKQYIANIHRKDIDMIRPSVYKYNSDKFPLRIYPVGRAEEILLF